MNTYTRRINVPGLANQVMLREIDILNTFTDFDYIFFLRSYTNDKRGVWCKNCKCWHEMMN